MAKVIKISEDKEVITVVKNIGFLKSVKDVVSGGDETNGYQDLIEESIKIGKANVSNGFEIQSVNVSPINDKNVMVQLNTVKL